MSNMSPGIGKIMHICEYQIDNNISDVSEPRRKFCSSISQRIIYNDGRVRDSFRYGIDIESDIFRNIKFASRKEQIPTINDITLWEIMI